LTAFTFISHSPRADACHSRSAAHSSRSEDNCPSTDCFYLFRTCVMDLGESEVGGAELTVDSNWREGTELEIGKI
jgi:hypothetical protein